MAIFLPAVSPLENRSRAVYFSNEARIARAAAAAAAAVGAPEMFVDCATIISRRLLSDEDKKTAIWRSRSSECDYVN